MLLVLKQKDHASTKDDSVIIIVIFYLRGKIGLELAIMFLCLLAVT